MSDKAEDDLIALVASEQRGFRRILFAGLAVLIVLVGMSVALSVYYYNVTQELKATSRAQQRAAFDARLHMDAQFTRVAAQELSVQRVFDEVRKGKSQAVVTPPGAALDAVRAYLQRGQHSLEQERVIEAAARAPDDASALHQVFAGAGALLEWELGGGAIPREATVLPDRLESARTAFRQALADPALAPLAQNGLAWVSFLDASSPQKSFALPVCDEVFNAVAASAGAGEPGPQPLYWRAQCERKLGRTADALRDYGLALRQSSAAIGASDDPAEILLAMNAYHGVGTVLIAEFDAPDDARMRAAIDLATRACRPSAQTTRAPRAHLALACLDQAIALRKRLRQSDNQLSGTAENKGFAYLRDGDFQAAFDNATKVEQTGLFAWNELIRAMSAKHVGAGANRARQQALLNVSFFGVDEFNICELGRLLSPPLFEEAKQTIASQHKGEEVVCR